MEEQTIEKHRKLDRANMAVTTLVHPIACLHVVTHLPLSEGRDAAPQTGFTFTSYAS